MWTHGLFGEARLEPLFPTAVPEDSNDDRYTGEICRDVPDVFPCSVRSDTFPASAFVPFVGTLCGLDPDCGRVPEQNWY